MLRQALTHLHQSGMALLVYLMLVPGISAQAQETTDKETPEESLCVYPPVKNIITPKTGKPANRTHLQADEADMSEQNYTQFSGSVIIEREGRRIEADKAKYSHQSENFNATGKVRYLTTDLEIKAKQANMNLKKNQGKLQDTDYRTLPDNTRGTAETITIDGPTRLNMDDATYTTCPPDNVAWELSASEITLDKESRQGSATHVVIDFMGVPFFYFPYLQFPLGDERMSGLLVPAFSISDKRGTEISLPLYWNIAPDLDATLTTHNMTRRGVMWETEFRYLNQNSQGQIELDYMEDDKLYGNNRRRTKWQHSSQADAGWSSSLNYQRVMDEEHLQDFGDDTGTTATTHLEQNASLNYNTQYWQFTSLVQDHQTLSGAKPYRKLPELKLASRFSDRDNSLNFNVNTEWTRFDHPDYDHPTSPVPITDRSHIQPYISLPLRSQAAFFVPKITGYYTQYELQHHKQPEKDEVLYRDVTVSTLDTGLFLERDTDFSGVPLVQTLEPRLFYVKAPYRDQSKFPLFDSGETAFSFDSLFQENRFTGIDRVGDTNQVTTALTTRFLHRDTGAELFSASIGRIHYLEDRDVGLNGNIEDDSVKSDMVARLAFKPAANWSISSDLQQNRETGETRYSTSRISYNRDNDHILTFGHRYRERELETRDVGLVWRFGPRWRFLAGNQYDIKNRRNYETIYGLNYDSCCWGLRIYHREYYNEQLTGPDKYENTLFLVLELKGFADFGQQDAVDTRLKQSIYGYSH
ncbi:MAG: LPS assembly protein LptD [Gammaproteobacteria bacterium]|nr:LPS assembly protein LptD [Gammaproteobacteria bacterium]